VNPCLLSLFCFASSPPVVDTLAAVGRLPSPPVDVSQQTLQNDLWAFVKTMPPFLAFCAIVVWLLLYLFKSEAKAAAVQLVRWVIGLVKESTASHKSLMTVQEHEAQAERQARLHQYTQHIADRLGCDHATVYGSKNGEYLKNQDSIEKLFMLSEAVPNAAPDAPRYMQIQREIYVSDIAGLWLAVCRNPYVVRQQGEALDAFTNLTMRQRRYRTIVCVLITSPLPGGGRLVLGLLSCAWKGFHLHPAGEPPPCVTPQMEALLQQFHADLSDLLAPLPH